MERIRRVGNSAILSDLAKKGVSEGKDEERVESMNVVPDTVVGRKEEEKKVRVEGGILKKEKKATNVVPDTVVGTRVLERESDNKTKGMNEDMMDMTVMKSVRVDVSDLKGWETVDVRVGELVIASKCCNEGEVKEVDLGRFASLKVFEVGDECFENVKEVKLIGQNQLEKVVIGQKCFMKNEDRNSADPNRHFYLKNCERLRELKIGCYSFSDYSVCEIENVPSLEVIEMGELNEVSDNFCYASMELKSECERMN